MQELEIDMKHYSVRHHKWSLWAVRQPQAAVSGQQLGRGDLGQQPMAWPF